MPLATVGVMLGGKAIRFLGKARIQLKCRRESVGCIGGAEIAGKALIGPGAFTKRNARIVDAVAASKDSLVTQSIGKAQTRAPRVFWWIVEGIRAGSIWPRTGESHRTQAAPRPRVGDIRIKARELVVAFVPGSLVVEAQA